MPNIRITKDLVIFDTETTGLNPRSSRIIEIAAARVSRSTRKIVDTYRAYLDHGIRIPSDIAELTGITDATIAEQGINPKDAVEGFLEFCGEDHAAAHNIRFDLSHLHAEIERQDVYPETTPWKFDTQELALRLLKPDDLIKPGEQLGKGKGLYKLSKLAEHFGISAEGAHAAAEDVRMLVEVTLSLIDIFEDRFGGSVDFETWMETPYFIDYMPWGKYAGVSFRNIHNSEPQYLQWAEQNMDWIVSNSIRHFYGKSSVPRFW